MKDKITLLIPTTAMRSAPSTKLIQRTLDSAGKRLFGGESVRCIVHFDMWDESPLSLEYLQNLRHLSKSRKFDLIYGSRGLGFATREMISMVDTDYYIFLEHDWEFVKPIDIDALVAMMDQHHEVNYIRFNKRTNAIAGYDKILEPSVIGGINLLRNDVWSANPHIGRTGTFKGKWINYLPSISKRGPEMEQFIHHAYIEDIESGGFQNASKEWGIFVYGKPGDKRVVKHLDGDKWRGTGISWALKRLFPWV